jgi:hypothetical protein
MAADAVDTPTGAAPQRRTRALLPGHSEQREVSTTMHIG